MCLRYCGNASTERKKKKRDASLRYNRRVFFFLVIFSIGGGAQELGAFPEIIVTNYLELGMEVESDEEGKIVRFHLPPWLTSA
jgi:hypothetical protein